MKIKRIRMVPKFITLTDVTAITAHFNLIDRRDQNIITAILSTDTVDVDDIVMMDLDVTDTSDIDLTSQEFSNDIMQLITAMNDDEVLGFGVTQSALETYHACIDNVFHELDALFHVNVPEPDANQNAALDPNRIYFPLVTGEIFDVEIDKVNWDDTLEHINDILTKLNSFRGIVYNMLRDHAETDMGLLDSAESIITSAYEALGMNPNYNKLNFEGNRKLEILAKLFDLCTVYNEFVTYINIYAIRSNTVKDLSDLIKRLTGQINEDTSNDTTEEMIEAIGEDVTPTSTEEIIDMIADNAGDEV